MPTIGFLNVIPWNVPMRSPYRSAQRITTVARNILVTVRLADGSTGYGESAPATYVTGETQESVVAAIEAITPRLIGLTVENALAFFADGLQEAPGARGALETAILDAKARASHQPFFAALPGSAVPHEFSLSTDISLPILSPEEAYRRALAFAADGFRAFKIKVGSDDRTEDEARVRAVAAAAPQATLRIDGNQGFTAGSAIAFVERLVDLIPRLELFEQPTKAGDAAAMRQVQAAIPLPVFADESVHHSEDAARLVGEEICRGVVLKLAKAGVQETLQIARTTYEHGGRCLFGCMMETRIGITAALHLVVALGSEIVPMLDLDGHLLVEDSGLVSGGLSQTSDILRIDPTLSGLGIAILGR